MSESDKDIIIGKAVREHAEGEKNLALLVGEAKKIAFTFKRLSEAFDETPPWKIVNHGEVLLSLFEKQEKMDWSKLTPESLKSLVSGLKIAIAEEKRTREERRKLGIS
jgi:hypothetical protein